MPLIRSHGGMKTVRNHPQISHFQQSCKETISWQFHYLKVIFMLKQNLSWGAAIPQYKYWVSQNEFCSMLSLDRELNPRPLAYGNTASIEGTTTLTSKPNPLLSNRRFNDQGRTQGPSIPWWTIPQLSILDPIVLHERPTEPFRMRLDRVWSNTSCLYNVQWNKQRETQIGSHI
jgi:hypothetical protein